MILNLQVFIFLIFSAHLIAQEVAIDNIIATDITTTDDDVLEIDFNDYLPNLPFIVAWINEDGQQYALQFVTREENLILPLSVQKGWNGKIGLLGLSINNVNATIRKTSFSDRWRIFMIAQPMTPGSINFTQSYIFFSYPFRWFCLAIMFIFWILLAIKYRNLHFSLLFAFALAWSLYDLRSIKNRWDIMTYLSNQDYQIDIFKEFNIFLTEAREIIDGKSWTKEPLSGVLNQYCTYQLGDLNYMPPNSESAEEADFIITTQPKNRPIIYSSGQYYLISGSTNK